MTARTILITGAKSGIGRATAEAFRTRGWTVVATDIERPDNDNSTFALTRQMDITRPDDITSTVQETIDHFGHLDATINAAGIGIIGALEACPDTEIHRLFDVNFFGAVNLMRAVLPHMRQQKRGTIVQVTSIGGRLAYPASSAYTASKFALEGLIESMRFELAGTGIALKVVRPGGIRTAFGDAIREYERPDLDCYHGLVERTRSGFEKGLRRAVHPEDVAATIAATVEAEDGTFAPPVDKASRALLDRRAQLSDEEWFRIAKRAFS